MSHAYVCSDINLALVPPHTWWIDTGTTIHICNSLQDFQTQRRPSQTERYIYMGDRNEAAVEAIGVCRLRLASGFILDLDETLYVSYFRWNLISILVLDRSGFTSPLVMKWLVSFLNLKLLVLKS